MIDAGKEAQILRKARWEQGMTQDAVAGAVGITLQQYQRYEDGTTKLSNASMRRGVEICLVLKIDPVHFIRHTK